MDASDVTIAIPTYNRGEILVQTITRLLAARARPREILVVDQTAAHPAGVQRALDAFAGRGEVRLLRLPKPSVPHAMNEALLATRTPLVLFLDDDVEPSDGLVAAHASAFRDDAISAVVGQILQPGESPRHHAAPRDDIEFRFSHDEGTFVANVMAGNLSVRRERALAIGGFDENFVGAAYRFESDFALRLVAAGGRIWFEPRASLRHLQLATGGLRSYGDHRTSPSPLHATGDYYFALRHRGDFWRYAATRMRKNVVTRWHLRHPWFIPPKLVGELRGLRLAFALRRRGPRLLGGE
jgi:GT2 family glycosyltransferase